MKTFVYYILVVVLFASCTEDVVDMRTENFRNNNSQKELIAYPNSQKGISRSSNLQSDWEKWTKVKLASGDSVYTPWNHLLSGTAIPYDIRTDVKAADGWNLIAHTVNGFGERGMNYLIFHNRYTGILKVFYNLETNQSNLQNTAIWKLHFENPQSFLAFSDNYARISTDKSVHDIYLSNISNDESKGYTVGWNCFQVELAYDPDFTDGYLQIIPMSMTTSSIKFDGTFKAKTSGTVISTTTSNPFNGVVKGVANIAGTRAKEWVSDEVKDMKFGDDVKNAFSSVAGDLVKSGIGTALGSLVGAFSKTTQTSQSVLLKTEGDVEMEGEMKTLQTGLIKPLSMSISVKDVGRLGVWCLTKEPWVLINPYVNFGRQSSGNSFWFVYNMWPLLDWTNTYNVVLNPDLETELKDKNISIETQWGGPTRYYAFGTNYTDNGMVNFINEGKKLYNGIYSLGGSHYEVTLPFWDADGNVIVDMDVSEAPNETYIPNAPDGQRGARPEFDTFSNLVSLFKVQFGTRNGNDVSLYHRFIPYLRWDYEKFNDGVYLEEYPAVPIRPKNSFCDDE